MRILKYLVCLGLLSLAAAQNPHTFPAKDTNNVFTGTNQFSQGVDPGSFTFSQLSPTAPNGRVTYCLDCVLQTPCAGGGSGAIAQRVNGQWACASGTSGGGPAGAVLLNPTGSQQVNQPTNTTFTVSGGVLQVLAGGSTNGFLFPDSGANASSVGTNNSAQFASGSTPGTQSIFSNGSSNYLPIWAAQVGGVTYATVLEMQANQGVTYPNLSNGTVPQSQLIQSGGIAGCDNTHVVLGDFSGCTTTGGSPAFSSIAAPGAGNTVTNSGPGRWQIGFGLTLTAYNEATGAPTNGHINADEVNFVSFPSGYSGGPLNAADAFPVVVSANPTGATLGGTIAPNCNSSGTALGYNTTTHKLTCNNVSLNPFHAMSVQQCNGTNKACPDASNTPPFVSGALVGSAADQTFETFKIPAGTINSDNQCIETLMTWKHSTAAGGSTHVTYKWWLGKDIQTQGSTVVTTNTVSLGATTCSNTGNCDNTGTPINWHLHVCRANTVSGTNQITYPWTDQMQAGTGSFAPNYNNSISVDWTSDQYITLSFNVANTDAVTFWGGMIWYP